MIVTVTENEVTQSCMTWIRIGYERLCFEGDVCCWMMRKGSMGEARFTWCQHRVLGFAFEGFLEEREIGRQRERERGKRCERLTNDIGNWENGRDACQ